MERSQDKVIINQTVVTIAHAPRGVNHSSLSSPHIHWVQETFLGNSRPCDPAVEGWHPLTSPSFAAGAGQAFGPALCSQNHAESMEETQCMFARLYDSTLQM